jgi:hypothetical protein
MKYFIIIVVTAFAAFALQVADYDDINRPAEDVVNARESRAYSKLVKPVTVLCKDSTGIALVGCDNQVLILTSKTALGRILISSHVRGDIIE